MHVFALIGLSLALGYAMFQKGGVRPEDQYPCWLAVALLTAFYWTRAWRRGLAPPPKPALRRLLVVVPLIPALEIPPLPAALVRRLSPARLELEQAMQWLGSWPSLLPLSAAPAATFEILLALTGCVLVFLLARELAWRFEKHPWLPVLPLIALAVLEAWLGLAQASDDIACGTYANRNHFAGLLAICLPFPLAWGLSILRCRTTRVLPVRPAGAACLLFAVVALLLAAVIRSESRMGFIASLVALAVVAAVELGIRRRLVLLFAAVAAAFVFLPTDGLIARFAGIAPDLSADTRAQLWRESLPIVRDYPVLGCGLGAYESVMSRYKTVGPLNTVDFAHNDYIQLLAEGGAVGFVLVMLLGVTIATAAARQAAARPRHARAYVSTACLAALSAIALHSMFDFNLHIPANAIAVAWISGLAAVPE